jgi:hypothetical protein
MAIAHARKQTVTTSVDYEPTNLRFIPMTTVSLTGSGTATITATHLDNEEVTLCAGLVTPCRAVHGVRIWLHQDHSHKG